MSRLSRDSWLAIGLFVLLAVITAVGIVQQVQQETTHPPLASFSNQPDGARALQLWLDSLGYRVDNDVAAAFRIPPDAGLVLMLEPFPGIEAAEWEQIDAWVEEGGTLLLAGSSFGTNLALRHYDFGLTFRPVTTTSMVQTPLMASPPLAGEEAPGTATFLNTERNDFVTHLAGPEGRPLVVSLPQGNGRLILSATANPFTNAGLEMSNHPQLVLNLISAAGESRDVWFDEWHHGVRASSEAAMGPGQWLRQTPLGRSLLYVAAVVFVALLLQGRLFGRPLPLSAETARRAPLEYITAIANLSRRAGHRTAVLQAYHHQLKKELGHRYRLTPTLSDAEFVHQLAQYNPNLNKEKLQRLLARLSRSSASEGELVQLAAEVAQWLKQ